MYKEIGSEFWINELKSCTSGSKGEIYFSKFGELYFTKSGRGALLTILDSVNIENRVALLPSYLCESIIKPFIDRNFECRFYDINKELSPEFNNVRLDDIGIFLHIGYFGFNTNNNIDCIIKELKDNKAIIIEDVTHKLFSRYILNDNNDLYIGSIRKWVGLPSGGFIANTGKLNINYNTYNTYNNKSMDAFVEKRLKAMILKSQYINNIREINKNLILNLFRESEEILDNYYDSSEIDDISLEILNTIDIDFIINKRKKNYLYLLNHMENLENIEVIFKELKDEICPFFFPIYVKNDRDKLREKLIKENIYCPIHWGKPLILNNKEMQSNYIYDHILSIPCDQRYGIDEMKKIVEVISNN